MNRLYILVLLGNFSCLATKHLKDTTTHALKENIEGYVFGTLSTHRRPEGFGYSIDPEIEPEPLHDTKDAIQNSFQTCKDPEFLHETPFEALLATNKTLNQLHKTLDEYTKSDSFRPAPAQHWWSRSEFDRNLWFLRKYHQEVDALYFVYEPEVRRCIILAINRAGHSFKSHSDGGIDFRGATHEIKDKIKETLLKNLYEIGEMEMAHHRLIKALYSKFDSTYA